MSRQNTAVGWCSISMFNNAERCSALLSESNDMAATPTSHFVHTNPILLRGDGAAGRCESLSPSLVPENFPESFMLHYAERRCLPLESSESGSFLEFSSSAITKRKQRDSTEGVSKVEITLHYLTLACLRMCTPTCLHNDPGERRGANHRKAGLCALGLESLHGVLLSQVRQ